MLRKGDSKMVKEHWYPKGSLQKPFVPQEISKVQQVFPANIGPLMPPVEDIPEEFYDSFPKNKWVSLFNDMFFTGLKSLDFEPMDNINPQAAMVHIRTIMGSYEPKHEYKAAAVAFLMSIWYKDVKWEKKDA